MLSYKQYTKLFEMPHIVNLDVDDDKLTPDEQKLHQASSYKHISTFKGHHIFTQVSPQGDHAFAVVNPETSKVTHRIMTSAEKGGLKVGGLYGTNNAGVKAHEIYHHLITHHGFTLHSDDTQSVGGAKVWKRLSEMPGVSVTHHSNATGTKITLNKGDKWNTNYGTNTHFRAKKA